MDNTSLQLAIKAIQDEARAPLEARLAEAVECCTIKDNRNLRLEAKVADLERQSHWALTGDMPTDSATVCLHQIHNGDTCEICGAKVTP